jgi:hypothetical protein
MIRLLMTSFPDGTSEPICLEVEDNVYVYCQDNLFEKLEDYTGYRIEVQYSGHKTYTKNYTIHEVIMDGVPTLDLRD